MLSLASISTYIFAGTEGDGVVRSTNNGGTWTQASDGLTIDIVSALVAIGTHLFAGTSGGGVFLSTDNGTSWNEVNNGLTDPQIYTLVVSGSSLFAGTMESGVFLSTDYGGTWTAVGEGLPATSVRALVTDGSMIFAGTDYRGVWRRPLREIAGVDNVFVAPATSMLEPPYPNPFRSSTTIGFRTSATGLVSLSVHNVLGQRIAVLVNEVRPPGAYTVSLDATGMASGVYFYRLQVGTLAEVERFVVVE